MKPKYNIANVVFINNISNFKQMAVYKALQTIFIENAFLIPCKHEN